MQHQQCRAEGRDQHPQSAGDTPSSTVQDGSHLRCGKGTLLAQVPFAAHQDPRAFLCKAVSSNLPPTQRLLMPGCAPPLVQHLAFAFTKGQEWKSKTLYPSFQDWFKFANHLISYLLRSLYSSMFFHLLPNLSSVFCNISTTIRSYKLLTDPICLATAYTSRSRQACSSRHTHLQAKRNIFK